MNNDKLKSPKIEKRNFQWLSKSPEKRSIAGDIKEEFRELTKNMGLFRARIWFFRQFTILFFTFLINSIHWSLMMSKNYIKIAFRNIKKQKTFSFINVFGLAVGMTCCILMLLWITDELSYDKFHKNGDYIYRMESVFPTSSIFKKWITTPAQLAPHLKADFPEIINSVRMHEKKRIALKYGNDVLYETGILYTSPSIFEVFSFNLLKGDPKSCLISPFSLVISEKIAKKYFGENEAIGKKIIVDNDYEFTITGILENVPHNSHLQFNFLAPFNTLRSFGDKLDDWGKYDYYTYILVDKNISIPTLAEKLQKYMNKFQQSDILLHIQPLKTIHLNEQTAAGTVKYVYILSGIAFLVLVIACFNFMSLSTARSLNRARETGMRKVAGAFRKNLIFQFLGESLLYSIFAMLISIVSVCIILPIFNSVSGKELTVSMLGNGIIIPGLFIITIAAGLGAGLYPSIFLSGFKIVAVLKNKAISGKSGTGIRRILVFIQFSISIFLIICSLSIFKQIDYIKHKNLGYTKEHLIYLRITDNIFTNRKFSKYAPILKEELLKSPHILKVSGMFQLPTYLGNTTYLNYWEGKTSENGIYVHTATADHDYFDLLGLEIINGRKFSENIKTDETSGFIINEEAAKQMGLADPIGKEMKIWSKTGRIVGVAKNFHFRPLYQKIQPLIININPENYGYLLMQIEDQNIHQAIEFIKKVWKKILPKYPLMYGFLDERIESYYKTDRQTAHLLNFFTIFAVIISSLGLFGLISYSAERRTKEIGIRKVLGATVVSILRLISREFLILVVLANLVSWPLAFYAVNNWLEKFAYKFNLRLDIFIISGLLAVLITGFTIGFQSFKAATANPVDSIKYE